jgi:hypothetical protein
MLVSGQDVGMVFYKSLPHGRQKDDYASDWGHESSVSRYVGRGECTLAATNALDGVRVTPR